MSAGVFGTFQDGTVVDDATVAAAAFLSAGVYSGPDFYGKLKYDSGVRDSAAGKTGLANYLHDNGWTPLGSDLNTFLFFPGVNQSSGLYESGNAVALAATKGDTLAVSIRGITGPTDVPGMISASLDSATYYGKVLTFIQEAIDYVKNYHKEITKLLITGGSLGGEIAELFAADPKSQQIISPFAPANVSIVTFSSPGIPSDKYNSNSPLMNRVLGIYNSSDPIYNHSGVFAVFSAFKHVGSQKELYTPTASFPTSHVQDTYEAEIQALTSSALFQSADAKTILVFDDGSAGTLEVNNASLGIPKGPHFIVALKGTDTIIGGPGDSILAWSGTHFITGSVGAGPNRYEIITGNDEISNFQNPKDQLTWHSNVPADGKFILQPYVRTVLTYTEANQQKGTITLDGVNLGPVASQTPSLHWEGTVTTA